MGMDTDKYIFVGLVTVGVMLIGDVRQRLLWTEPLKRLRIGLGLLAVSITAFIVAEALLPRPLRVESGTSSEYVLQGALYIWAFVTILALTLTASAALQLFKRWQYFRRVGD